jgi:thiol-disulfide isomerase/thioredoxin
MKVNCIIAVVAGLIACNGNVNQKPITADLIREIDKLRLMDLNGKAIPVKQYEGKTVFINFWATWCKPCVEEMSSIADARDSVKGKGVIFLLASGEELDQIIEFGNTHNYKFNYVRIENGEEMNVQALPTTFIFNNRGEKVFTGTGARKWNEKNNIDTILKIAKQYE